MRVNKLIGIDIGNYRVKFSCLRRGELQDFFYETLPENMVRDGRIQAWDALGEFIKECLKKHGARKYKYASIAVPMTENYLRRSTLPLMTVGQLELNLPYEFHDYIAEESRAYFYDYAVLGRSEKNLDIQASAMSRELIDRYRALARNAGLVPVALVPEVLAYQRIARRYLEHSGLPAEKDFAILDMGERAFRIHFIRSGVYETTRSLEPGCLGLVEKLAELKETDLHLSRLAMEAGGEILKEEPLLQMYDDAAVQIMRVLNFYSFNNPQNTIDTLYCCGGGIQNSALLERISEQLSLPLRPLTELLPELPEGAVGTVLHSPQAYGVTVQAGGAAGEKTEGRR